MKPRTFLTVQMLFLQHCIAFGTHDAAFIAEFCRRTRSQFEINM